ENDRRERHQPTDHVSSTKYFAGRAKIIFSWLDHVIAGWRWQRPRGCRRTPVWFVRSDRLSRNWIGVYVETLSIQVSIIASTCPSATTSSRLTRMDLSLPAAGAATGISIFIASTNATSSPSPTL